MNMQDQEDSDIHIPASGKQFEVNDNSPNASPHDKLMSKCQTTPSPRRRNSNEFTQNAKKDPSQNQQYEKPNMFIQSDYLQKHSSSIKLSQATAEEYPITDDRKTRSMEDIMMAKQEEDVNEQTQSSQSKASLGCDFGQIEEEEVQDDFDSPKKENKLEESGTDKQFDSPLATHKCEEEDFDSPEKKQFGNDKEMMILQITEVDMNPQSEQKRDLMHSVDGLHHEVEKIVTYGSQIQKGQQLTLDKAEQQIREQIQQIKQLEVKITRRNAKIQKLLHRLKEEQQQREEHLDPKGLIQKDDPKQYIEEIEKVYDLFLMEKKQKETFKIENQDITTILKEQNTKIQQFTAQKDQQVRSLMEQLHYVKESSPCMNPPDYQDGDKNTDSTPVGLILQQSKEIIRLKQENQNLQTEMAEMRQNMQTHHDSFSRSPLHSYSGPDEFDSFSEDPAQISSHVAISLKSTFNTISNNLQKMFSQASENIDSDILMNIFQQALTSEVSRFASKIDNELSLHVFVDSSQIRTLQEEPNYDFQNILDQKPEFNENLQENYQRCEDTRAEQEFYQNYDEQEQQQQYQNGEQEFYEDIQNANNEQYQENPYTNNIQFGGMDQLISEITKLYFDISHICSSGSDIDDSKDLINSQARRLSEEEYRQQLQMEELIQMTIAVLHEGKSLVQGSARDLSQKIDQLEGENTQIKQQNLRTEESYMRERNDLNAQIQDSQNCIDALQKEKQTLVELYEEKLKDKKNNDEQEIILREQASSQAKIKSLDKNVRDLERYKEAMDVLFKEQEENYKKGLQQLAKKLKVSVKHSKEIEILETNQKKLEEKMDLLKKDLERSKESQHIDKRTMELIEGLKQSKLLLETEVNQLKEVVQQKTNECETFLMEKIANQKSNDLLLETNVQQSQVFIEDLKNKGESCQKEISYLRAYHQEQMKYLEESYLEKYERSSDHYNQKEFEELKDKLPVLEESIRELKESNSELVIKINQVAKEKEESDVNNSQLTDQLAQLKVEESKLTASQQQLTSQVKELQPYKVQHEEKTIEIQKLSGEITCLNDKYQGLLKEFEQQSQIIKQNRQKEEILANKLQEFTDNLTKNQKENIGLKEEIQQISKKLSTLEQNYSNDLLKATHKSQNEMIKAKEELSQCEAHQTWTKVQQELLGVRNKMSQSLFDEINFFLRETHTAIQSKPSPYLSSCYQKTLSHMMQKTLEFNHCSQRIYESFDSNPNSVGKMSSFFELISEQFTSILPSIISLSSEIIRQHI